MISYGGEEEHNNRANLLDFHVSGVLVRNGGSFEDDLSLGAEGMFVWKNYFHAVLYSFLKIEKLQTFTIVVLRAKCKDFGNGSHVTVLSFYSIC